MTYQQVSHEIEMKLSRIKEGDCPNFYLSGSSYSALEKAALHLAEEIGKRQLIHFQGARPQFTIVMPYFNDLEGAKSFLHHLKSSVSIARDCYSEYQGLVLVECAREWKEKGRNRWVSLVVDYISKHREITFIVIDLEKKGEDGVGNLYYELSRAGLWMTFAIHSPSPSICAAHFQNIACENGLTVSPNAQNALLELVKGRDETDISNLEVVGQLIKQIVFERWVNGNREKVIEEGEIKRLSGKKEEKPFRKIGFTVED